MSFAKRSQSGFVPIPLLILLLILAAVPLTVIVSQKQQEIRQRASEVKVCSSDIDTSKLKSCSSLGLQENSSCPLEGDTKLCNDVVNNIVYTYTCTKESSSGGSGATPE